MISRKQFADRVAKALKRNPVVALLVPRQGGKTTLARQMVPTGHPYYYPSDSLLGDKSIYEHGQVSQNYRSRSGSFFGHGL